MRWTGALILVGAVAVVVGAQPPAGAKEEMKKIAGTWERIVYKSDGVAEDPETSRHTIWEQAADGKYKLVTKGVVLEEGLVEVDPTKTPKHMNSEATNGEGKVEKLVAIYKMQGDTIEICWVNASAPRPTDFTCQAGSKRIYEFWRRVK